MNKLHTITLPETSGTQTIAQATDIFTGYIDSDFKKWKTNTKDTETKEMKVDVYEMTHNATLAQLFTTPEKMCLTQEQIIEFCKNHTDKLRQDGYNTFFLFKVSSEFFVASVRVGGVVRLYVFVDRLSYDFVWRAEYRRRFVFPQLTLEPSDTETLSSSDSSLISQIRTWVENERGDDPRKKNPHHPLKEWIDCEACVEDYHYYVAYSSVLTYIDSLIKK